MENDAEFNYYILKTKERCQNCIVRNILLGNSTISTESVDADCLLRLAIIYFLEDHPEDALTMLDSLVLIPHRFKRHRFDIDGFKDKDKQNDLLIVSRRKHDLTDAIILTLAQKYPEWAYQMNSWAAETVDFSLEYVQKRYRDVSYIDHFASGLVWQGFAFLNHGNIHTAYQYFLHGAALFRASIKTGIHLVFPIEYALPRVLIPLCEYQLKPTQANLLKAQQGIEDYINTFSEPELRLDAYLYYLHLKNKFSGIYIADRNQVPEKIPGQPVELQVDYFEPDYEAEIGRGSIIIVGRKNCDTGVFFGNIAQFQEFIDYVRGVGKFIVIPKLMDSLVLGDSVGTGLLEEECRKLIAMPGIEPRIKDMADTILEAVFNIAYCGSVLHFVYDSDIFWEDEEEKEDGLKGKNDIIGGYRQARLIGGIETFDDYIINLKNSDTANFYKLIPLSLYDREPGRSLILMKNMVEINYRLYSKKIDLSNLEPDRSISSFITNINFQIDQVIYLSLISDNSDKAKKMLESASVNGIRLINYLQKDLNNSRNLSWSAAASLWQAYTLILLGDYARAHACLLPVVPLFDASIRDGLYLVYSVEYMLTRALIPLCELRLEPTRANLLRAQQGIETFIDTIHEPRNKLSAYLYYFHLKEVFADVYSADPDSYPDTLPDHPSRFQTDFHDLYHDIAADYGCVVIRGLNEYGTWVPFATTAQFQAFIDYVEALGGFPTLSRLMELLALSNLIDFKAEPLEEECRRLLAMPGIDAWVKEKVNLLIEAMDEVSPCGSQIFLKFDDDINWDELDLYSSKD